MCNFYSTAKINVNLNSSMYVGLLLGFSFVAVAVGVFFSVFGSAVGFLEYVVYSFLQYCRMRCILFLLLAEFNELLFMNCFAWIFKYVVVFAPHLRFLGLLVVWIVLFCE